MPPGPVRPRAARNRWIDLPPTLLAALAVANAAALAQGSAGDAPGAGPSEPGDATGAVAILVIGGAVLLALLVAVAAKAGRPTGTAPPRAATESADPWREAGRRHHVPPGEGRGEDGEADDGAFG